jgi:hypothetical protein
MRSSRDRLDRNTQEARESNMNPEEKLRERIRRTMLEAGIELAPEFALRLEDQIMQLFRNYSTAPEERKNQVYAAGEEGILNTLDIAISDARSSFSPSRSKQTSN